MHTNTLVHFATCLCGGGGGGGGGGGMCTCACVCACVRACVSDKPVCAARCDCPCRVCVSKRYMTTSRSPYRFLKGQIMTSKGVLMKVMI